MSSSIAEDIPDVSTERRPIQYHVDNLGLQLELGFPFKILGVQSIEDKIPWPHVFGDDSGMENFTQLTTVDGIPIRKVYVTNIHFEVQRQELHMIFGSYGTIMNIYLRVSKNDNCKQFAFITFQDPMEAARVLRKRKFQDIRGRSMYVTAADSWHQPKNKPDGTIIWKVDPKAKAKQEEESEEDDDRAAESTGGEIKAPVVYEEGINVLNDDCLMHIFSFLTYKEISGVERVCKRWQGLSFRMWKCLHKLIFPLPAHLSIEIPTTTPILEQYLRRCGNSLSVLDLIVINHTFNETTLAVIAKYCSNLEVLRVANIDIGNRSLAHLGRSCPRLKELVIESCAKFNDNDLMSLLPKCPELTHLVLSHSNGVSGKCLANIEGPMTSLKLSNCPAIETNHLIAGLNRMSNTLQSLTLTACGTLRSSEVSKIVSAVPNLTSLSLSRCFPQFDLKSLSPVGLLTKLTTLNLTLNNAVTDSVLEAIVNGCCSLTSINLCGSGGGSAGILSERGLYLLSHLLKLTDLDISYLEACNDTSLKNISARNTRLKRIVCRGCSDLTDEGSIQVVTNCNDLELFDLSGCNNIGDNTVTAAMTSVKMRTNNVPLKLIVGGTAVQETVKAILEGEQVTLLTVDLEDLSEEHLRPDFIDDMFFPPSDSDEEQDLDHLCCDCDFDFDDLYDATIFESNLDDDTPKFGAYDDTDDGAKWIDPADDWFKILF